MKPWTANEADTWTPSRALRAQYTEETFKKAEFTVIAEHQAEERAEWANQGCNLEIKVSKRLKQIIKVRSTGTSIGIMQTRRRPWYSTANIFESSKSQKTSEKLNFSTQKITHTITEKTWSKSILKTPGSYTARDQWTWTTQCVQQQHKAYTTTANSTNSDSTTFQNTPQP